VKAGSMADMRSTHRYHPLDAHLAILGQVPVKATRLAYCAATNIDTAVIACHKIGDSAVSFECNLRTARQQNHFSIAGWGA